jgi:hypothetical protein
MMMMIKKKTQKTYDFDENRQKKYLTTMCWIGDEK